MSGHETLLLALALVLVPMTCWLAGRWCGRRNWAVVQMLGVAIAAVIIELAAMTAITRAVMSGPPGEMLGKSWIGPGWPEFPLFLLMLGIFLALLGWAGTPANPKRVNSN